MFRGMQDGMGAGGWVLMIVFGTALLALIAWAIARFTPNRIDDVREPRRTADGRALWSATRSRPRTRPTQQRVWLWTLTSSRTCRRSRPTGSGSPRCSSTSSPTRSGIHPLGVSSTSLRSSETISWRSRWSTTVKGSHRSTSAVSSSASTGSTPHARGPAAAPASALPSSAQSSKPMAARLPPPAPAPDPDPEQPSPYCSPSIAGRPDRPLDIYPHRRSDRCCQPAGSWSRAAQ